MSTLIRSPRSPLGLECYDPASIARAEKLRPSSLPWRTVLTMGGPSNWVKRSVDLAGALGGLVLFSPVLLAIALFIRLDSPGPALFRQVRRGHRGRPFRMLKFRTMVTDAEQTARRPGVVQRIRGRRAVQAARRPARDPARAVLAAFESR